MERPTLRSSSGSGSGKMASAAAAMKLRKLRVDTDAPVLVTGATGYLAGVLIKELLDLGVTVHGTVRNLSKKKHLRRLMSMADASPGSLRFFLSDLLVEGSFTKAMQDCRVIFHLASPASEPTTNPQTELIDPAIQGIRSLLRQASQTPSVERIVMTSSCAAMYTDASDVDANRGLKETDWNHSASLTYQPYNFCKTLVEQAAWTEAGSQAQWTLVVMNPALILGPSALGSSIEVESESFGLMASLAGGDMRHGCPDISLGVVDVRDVAHAHVVAAYTESASGRYLLAGHSSSFWQIVQILKKKYPDYPLPSHKVPKWWLWTTAHFMDMNVGWGKHRFVQKNINVPIRFDTTKAETELSIRFRPLEKTVEQMMEQLIASGTVQPKRKGRRGEEVVDLGEIPVELSERPSKTLQNITEAVEVLEEEEEEDDDENEEDERESSEEDEDEMEREAEAFGRSRKAEHIPLTIVVDNNERLKPADWSSFGGGNTEVPHQSSDIEKETEAQLDVSRASTHDDGLPVAAEAEFERSRDEGKVTRIEDPPAAPSPSTPPLDRKKEIPPAVETSPGHNDGSEKIEQWLGVSKVDDEKPSESKDMKSEQLTPPGVSEEWLGKKVELEEAKEDPNPADVVHDEQKNPPEMESLDVKSGQLAPTGVAEEWVGKKVEGEKEKEEQSPAVVVRDEQRKPSAIESNDVRSEQVTPPIVSEDWAGKKVEVERAREDQTPAGLGRDAQIDPLDSTGNVDVVPHERIEL